MDSVDRLKVELEELFIKAKLGGKITQEERKFYFLEEIKRRVEMLRKSRKNVVTIVTNSADVITGRVLYVWKDKNVSEARTKVRLQSIIYPDKSISVLLYEIKEIFIANNSYGD